MTTEGNQPTANRADGVNVSRDVRQESQDLSVSIPNLKPPDMPAVLFFFCIRLSLVSLLVTALSVVLSSRAPRAPINVTFEGICTHGAASSD